MLNWRTRLLALSLALSASNAMAQNPAPLFDFNKAPGRLPKNVVPVEYAVAVVPDIASLTLSGSEEVVLDFKERSAVIQFNSLNQKLSKVLLDGQAVQQVVSDDEAQLTTITLKKPVSAGRHRLRFSFAGRIEKETRGLFLQEYRTPSGAAESMLTTQFEPTDARRMFPCWDEPAFRAVFKLRVTAPAAWAIYSNMPQTSRSVRGALATTAFAATPKMSTYLLHFTAGNFAHIAADSYGAQVRVVTVKGQEAGGTQALANARQILADYNDYFDVAYPLPKLDSIAVPGGVAGAMENWGALIFNDQFLLVTPSSTQADRQQVYRIQAHEMAHQWFGNLVTMGWWDDLWLNESFASWLSAKQTDLRHPAWRWWEQQDALKEEAMHADARLASHPIEQHVSNELQAANAFDVVITYNKGQAVLRMLEAHMGEEKFRQGIRHYMKRHAYANTASGNLWQALDEANSPEPESEVAGLDPDGYRYDRWRYIEPIWSRDARMGGYDSIQKIASSWITQPGFPLVSVMTECDSAGNRTMHLSQQRFLLQGMGQGAKQAAGLWQVPLQVRAGDGVARPLLFSAAQQSSAAGRCDEALSINVGAAGYFRVQYDNATLATNTRLLAGLQEADRIVLLDDQWALVNAGLQPLSSYLALVSAMGNAPQQRAWTQINEALATIEVALRDTAGHGKFLEYARSVLKPVAVELGWHAQQDEAPGMQILRQIVLANLGAWGDAEAVAQARQQFSAFVADRNAVAADEQATMLKIIAGNSTAAEFAQLRQLARTAGNETESRRYYLALMQVQDPALAREAALIAVSDEIPKQSDQIRLTLVETLAAEHPQLAWETLKANVDQLLAPLQPYAAPFLAHYAPAYFWRTDDPDGMKSWLKTKLPPDSSADLTDGMEAVRYKLIQQRILADAAGASLQTPLP